MRINLDKRVADLRRRGVIVSEDHENKTVDFALADTTLGRLSNKKLKSLLAEVKAVVLLLVLIGYKVSANGQAVSFADCQLPTFSERPRGGFVDGTVTHVFEHEVTEWLSIDGLQVTHEHPFYVIGKGWVKAGELKPGDVLFTDNAEYKPVQKIEQMTGKTKVYNLEVNPVHTYFAGGVLVHNKRAETFSTGGKPNWDNPVIVGDAPGGQLTPYSEVIWNGYVFNASETKALKAAGLLDGASHMAAGSGGGAGRSSRSIARPGGRLNIPPGGRRNIPAGGRVGGGAVSMGSASAEAGTSDDTAAMDVADAAANTAAMVVSSNENTQEAMQSQTQQQVNATQESSAAVVEKLDEVARILKKQATAQDMYALWHGGQQTNI